MPALPDDVEKSPVDKDYEGLQLDTRARDPEKHLDQTKPQAMLDYDFGNHMNYINEKQAHGGPTVREDPSSPDSACETGNGFCMTGYGPTISPSTPGMSKGGFETFDIQSAFPAGPEAGSQKRRIFGLRRRYFWMLAGFTLTILIAAAVVGGIIGGMQARNKHTSQASAPADDMPSGPQFTQAQSADVMIGSPLNVVSYDLGGSDSGSKRQAFRIYYQSLLGNIKEATSIGSNSWQSARPIFTDALNNTGLASLTYLNGTQQQGSIFYVGMNGLLQEKRKVYDSPQYWLPASLNNLNLPMVGQITSSLATDGPRNSWDSYRMAAVYSTNFMSGPGARLFYHAQHLDGSNIVQELVWSQNNDTWSQGAAIEGVRPNSHLAATIDESIGILRLFYSAGNETLQESWTSLSDTGGNYRIGLHLPNFLNRDCDDLAVVSGNGTTYLYHHTSANQTAKVGIHELIITGVPNSANNQETFNLSEPFVVEPRLTSGNNASLYQPIAAGKTVVPGIQEQLFVYWADDPTGDPSKNDTGYGALSQVSRTVANSTWPSITPLQVPLGSDNSQQT